VLNLFLEFNGQRETLGKTVLYFSNAKSLFAESKLDISCCLGIPLLRENPFRIVEVI